MTVRFSLLRCSDVRCGSCVTSTAGPHGGAQLKGGPFEVGNQVLISSHRKLLSSKATMGASAGTKIFFSPSLYFNVNVRPSTAATICSMFAFVIVLWGRRSHG